MSDDVREARRRRRAAERRWRKTGLTVHKEIFVRERAAVVAAIERAKQQHFEEKINSSSSSKDMFAAYSELQGRSKSMPLPTSVPRCDLPQKFCDFFSTKIQQIRSALDSTSSSCDPPSFTVYDGPSLSCFRPVSEQEVRDLIMSSPTKSCVLDPIPTSLLKQCIGDLVPVIAAIVNVSLSTGIVPSQFKHAVVVPLLKKAGLDVNDLKNFRPVSNLPFVSKILEKAVLKQLQCHLSENDLLEVHQSAYRRGHSTETAALSVLDGLLVQADERLVSLVALLDLSAAFDTLDHSVLLRRLEITFGVQGTALAWFSSYLKGRAQSVVVDGQLSDPSVLMYGVPQGSVLGPVLFTLYSQPLSDVIIAHRCAFHKYADDTELSQSAPASQFTGVQSNIQACISDVLAWMTSNKLKLNTEKTEVMPVGAQTRLSVIDCGSMSVGRSVVPLQKCVKYLGVKIDQTLSMQDQISSVCRAAYLELRRISQLRPFLSSSCW